MTRPARLIERLTPPVADADMRGFAGLLLDAVSSGAAVSFLGSLTLERVVEWWREVFAKADARAGAEQLYRQTGWTVAGTIPGYALDPDGATLHDTVIFYKELDHAAPNAATPPASP